MKKESKNALVVVSVVLVAIIAYEILLHIVAARDPVALLVRGNFAVGAAIGVALALRIFLMFVAPGWAMYAAFQAVAPVVLARRRARLSPPPHPS